MEKSKKGEILISVISPVYMAESIIDKLVDQIRNAVSQISDRFEIILVDDRSTDRSWEKIVENCKKHEEVKGIRLSRNFGQQNALTAGFKHSNGKWIVILDCDLQDNPEEILKMYSKVKEGYDIVLAKRSNRKDGYLKVLSSKYFNKLLGYLTDTIVDDSIANFALFNRKVIDAMASMKDFHRFFPLMIKWVGFNLTTIEIEHNKRKDGKSSYTFKKRIRLAIDTILSFSDKLLRLTIKLGILILISSMLGAMFLVVRYFFDEITVTGWTSTFMSIWFLAGLVISVMGVVGLYIGKIFESIKARPTYIVDEFIDS